MSRRPHEHLAGRYRLISTIGEGGMGRVWHARDELLGRDVAIKEVIPEGLTRAELGDLHERTIREARAIAQISHPSVVRIFDVVDDDGTPWIVMELIRSRSLQEVIAQDGPLAPEEAARIGLAVLDGLRAVHQEGILHRDVKPANVLLTTDGRVVLTDFGLAISAADSSMTRTGIVLGSPSYLAPERAHDQPADAKADLWSLGATLFTAIEGHPPFEKSSPMATLSALLIEPPPVSEKAGVLQPVLAALLRKDPAERADADQTERMLKAARAGDTAALEPADVPAPVAVPVPAPGAVPVPAPGAVPVAGPPATVPRQRWLIPAVAALLLAGGFALTKPFSPVTPAAAPAPSVASVDAPAPVATPSAAAVTSTAPRRRPASAPTQKLASAVPSNVVSPSATPAPSPSKAAAPAPVRTTAAPTTAAVGSQIWNHGTGTCLHVARPGGEVQMWQCNGSNNQRFHFPGDGTLRVLGQCVELSSGASGARMRAASCSGSARQQFVLQAARDLVNPASDKCVDVADWNTGNGAPAQLWTCAGTDNQKWN